MNVEKLKQRFLEMGDGVTSDSGKPYRFQWGTYDKDDERPFIELDTDGKIALVATERGNERMRRETHDVDEFLYFLWCDAIYGRQDGETFEEEIERAAETMRKIAPHWETRYRAERIEQFNRVRQELDALSAIDRKNARKPN